MTSVCAACSRISLRLGLPDLDRFCTGAPNHGALCRVIRSSSECDADHTHVRGFVPLIGVEHLEGLDWRALPEVLFKKGSRAMKRQITVAKIGAALALGGLFACGFVAPSQAAAGWQSPFLFSVPTGEVSLFFHYPCPAAFPIAQNGAFEMNGTGQTSQVSLGYNGPRYDESPPTTVNGVFIFTGLPARLLALRSTSM